MYRASSGNKCKRIVIGSKGVSTNYAMEYMHMVNPWLVMLLIWTCASLSVTFRTNFTRQPLLGYQCVPGDPASQITWLDTSRTQCVWRCLSNDDCVVVSHNHRLKRCVLSTQICASVVSHTEFSVNLYGMDRKFCSSWVSKSGYIKEKAVEFAKKLDGTSSPIAVARKEVSSGLFPGKCKLSTLFTIIIAVDENTYVSDDRGEILLVDSACFWTWIPYTSPDVLPIGAVAGGQGVSKEPLYVARALFGNTYSIGYYKSSKLHGCFMIRNNVTTTTAMEILVIL